LRTPELVEYRGNNQAVTDPVSVQLENSKSEVSAWIDLNNFETELNQFQASSILYGKFVEAYYRNEM
jgi:hypothetical protein